MADERTKAPYNQESPVPVDYGWPSLIKKPAGAPADGPSPLPVPPQFIVIDNVIGRRAAHALKRGTPLDWPMIR